MAESHSDIIVGIDLGTTFSLVAYADERGPQVIRDERGEGRLPSVVAFLPDGRAVIGWEARAHAVENPRHTVYSIKRLMGIGAEQLRQEAPFLAYRVGRRGEESRDAAAGTAPAKDSAEGRDVVAIQIDGTWLTPQEISALVLRALKDRAEAHIGRPVRKAVITVPAYFDDSQRQATRDAGRIAGLEVLRIVNEPTAAALAYGLGVGSETATIAVYDLGGGTFDVSILRLEEGVFEVLGTHGNTHLGGDDFDRTIIRLVQREVTEQFGVTIDSPATRQALRQLAERVKIQLSEQDSASLELDLGRNRTYRRAIMRAEFEAMIGQQVNMTLDSCRRALAEASIETKEIERVVLVGGSSRIPLVVRRVAEFFDTRPYTALNPDEVVALGAAVQAQILAGTRRDLLLLDVTPLALGIETMGGAMGKLIAANTRIPCRTTEMFTTFVDGQANVKIAILQGERELAADCRRLGEFELRGIPPMPAGLPKIEVAFLIDANGILDVSARELRSGVEASIQVIPAHGLTAAEVRAMAQAGVQFARQDMSAHRLIDLRNQVAFDTHKAEQMLAKHAAGGSGEDAESLRAAIRDLRQLASESDDAERIYEALQRFDRMTIPLAEQAIRDTLRDIQ